MSRDNQRALSSGNRVPRIWRIIGALWLAITLLTMSLPLWNMLAISFSTSLDSMKPGIILWPEKWSLEGFELVWYRVNVNRAFFNSAAVTMLGILIQMVLSTLAAYVLTQNHLPGRHFISSFILVTLMIPADLTLTSLYLLNRNLNLLNSYSGLILNGLVSGFAIFLLLNYFSAIPTALAESARVDSATESQVFFYVYLPLSLPGIASVTFLEFIGKWNSLLMPSMLITNPDLYTLPLVLRQLTFTNQSLSGIDFIAPNAKMAGIVISIIPLIVLYGFTQRYLIEGLTMGATKG